MAQYRPFPCADVEVEVNGRLLKKCLQQLDNPEPGELELSHDGFPSSMVCWLSQTKCTWSFFLTCPVRRYRPNIVMDTSPFGLSSPCFHLFHRRVVACPIFVGSNPYQRIEVYEDQHNLPSTL